MSKIIDYFKRIAQIPHCSKAAERLKDFLVAFARTRGYEVETDKTGNIHIFKGMPKVCLQGHYDMVCMGKAPQIETYVEEGVMRAKESSLGADNGMAIAMMMALMDEGREIECLITADEEIGLIGANAVEFDLKADYMLNLDSEDEAEVYIGCAGGADIVATKTDRMIEGEGRCYEVRVSGLPGGHSGVDIDKGIPSAIKVLSNYLLRHGVTQLVSIEGGTRRNAIAAEATAIIRTAKQLKAEDHIELRACKGAPQILQGGESLLHLIDTFKQGVHTFNEALRIPHSSINLAIVSSDNTGKVRIETSARAMDGESLEALTEETTRLFESYGFACSVEDKYPAWKPEISVFAKLVDTQMRAVFGKSDFRAIHAGLECGVLASKYPQMQFASIGPTIRYPHSTREEVLLSSVEKTYEVLCRILEAV